MAISLLDLKNGLSHSIPYVIISPYFDRIKEGKKG